MKHHLIGFYLFFALSTPLLAQPDDANVIISSRHEIYTFEESKGAVSIIEKSETNYECLKMGATLPIAEMYDNQSSIEKIKIKGDASKPKYNQYSSADLFYTDAKVCHFDLWLTKKGATAQVKFEKRYNDPRYFTSIYLSESLFVKEKTVTIIIPDWMNVELNERNFGSNITKEVKLDSKKKERVYQYTIKEEPEMKSESQMPGRSHIYPHLLFITKSATLKGDKITYFEQLDDLYAWYHTIVKEVKNDQTILKAKADEIVKECQTDEEKIKTLFAWVQSNIRYIAFEDGVAGFKPDDAQEVLRKKYGDCKGMANLLKTLLEVENFDARLAWIGTKHIAYDYSTPSLSADNHMICALFFENKTYYLDPTVKYMPLGEYPNTIQGRQTLVEDTDRSKYLLNRIPVFSPNLNTDSLSAHYTVTGGALIGNIKQYYAGESKQVLLSLIDATPKDKIEEALKKSLEQEGQNRATQIALKEATSQSKRVEISYGLSNKSGLQTFNNEQYITLDLDQEFKNSKIDTTKRVNDFEFSYPHHVVKNIKLTIPDGYTLSHLPANLHIEKEGYLFQLKYSQQGTEIFYTKELTIKNTLLKKQQFTAWNDDISKLAKAYLEQLTITKK